MTFTHRLSRRMALLRDAATIGVLAVVASCDILTPVDTSGLDLAQVVVVPGSTTLEPNQNYQFSGYGRTKTGDSVAVAVVWSATGGTISSSGRYTADTLQGDYEVRATLARPGTNAAASSGSSVVKVRKLAQLLVTPVSVTLPTRGTKAFAAYGRLNGGDSVAVTVTWAATGGSISPAGLYTAGPTAGDYGVTATGRGFSAPAAVSLTSVPVASLSVSPPNATLSVGATQQLTAVTKDSAGSTLTGRVVTWSSSNPTAATVSGSGLVTAIAAGPATITATSEGKNGTSAITVQAPPPVLHGGYYVAPTGLPTGDGSAARPWNLATALAQPTRVQPGDTIWLRGGIYSVGALTSSLTGTATAPIIVRQYPGERAIIDGHFTISAGSYVWFWGLEVLNSILTDPEYVGFNIGPTSGGSVTGIKVINCIIHDLAGVGIGAWTQASDVEVYGNLVYNNGRMGSEPGRHGHGFYIQNQAPAVKRFIDNILFNQYSHNIHAYSELSPLDNLYFEGNISFNARAYTNYGGREYLVGGSPPVNNLTFKNNYGYRPGGGDYSFGLYDDSDSPPGSSITDNYFDNLVQFNRWTGLVVTGNTFVRAPWEQIWLRIPSASNLPNFTWNNNTYRWNSTNTSNPFELYTAGVGVGYTFAGWRAATGFDASSDFQQALPTGQVIRVRPNQYEPGRANVVVYNWSGATTATVDLSNVLRPGDQFEVREVQNYFGTPALSGTYAGGAVSLPMTVVIPPPPLGLTDFPALSTGTTFHAFVVLRK
jgi:Big-like domain-containing protein